MVRQKVTIALDPKLVQKIDDDRGLIPRSRYIEKLLKESLANMQNNPPKGTDHPRPIQAKPPHPFPNHSKPILPKPTQTRPDQPKPQAI